MNDLQSRYSALPIRAQTAFAQLMDAALRIDHARSVASLSGSFSRKTVKGKTYWYYRHTDLTGRQRQIYIGPDSPQVRQLAQDKQQSPTPTALRQLARIAAVAGCQVTPPAHFKVIRRLSEYGFFHAGGVAIGSHAFIAYANLLGVHWGGDASAMTLDIDFAHAGRHFSVALPADMQVNTAGAIESLQMGFIPLFGGSGKGGGTWVIPDEPDFTLDFVTPQTSDDALPYRHEQLGISLQPLRFMEYSLQDVQQTALFDMTGAVVINVPHPARYALHKLIVFGERAGAHRAKAGKDLQQSALLLHVLREQRPHEVEDAWADLLGRGPGWRRRAHAGVLALDRAWPRYGFKAWLDGASLADPASETT